MSTIFEKIYTLARQRNWGVNEDFLKRRGNSELVIGRFGVKKYYDIVKNLQTDFSKMEAYLILDRQMVDIIKKFIPEVKDYVFYFYSTKTGYNMNTEKVRKTKNIVK